MTETTAGPGSGTAAVQASEGTEAERSGVDGPVSAAVEPAGGASGEPCCALCGVAIPTGAERLVNRHVVCASCAEQVLKELRQTAPTTAELLRAALGGLVGACLGAGIWAAIAVAMDSEIGYVAVLVGFLAGMGVKLAARDKRGGALPHLAVAMAVFGLVLAKYLIFAHYLALAVREETGVEIGYLSRASVDLFPSMIAKMLSAFDLLWVFLAVSAAWRVPAAPAVRVGP
ncbi:MAG: hypothetical protein JW751_04205 [Polyangiaceae bacterium]|nr:hypothetical protein [Polyangiaceae bacterium]